MKSHSQFSEMRNFMVERMDKVNSKLNKIEISWAKQDRLGIHQKLLDMKI